MNVNWTWIERKKFSSYNALVKKNIHEQCFVAKDYLILQNFEDQVDLKWEKLHNIDDELIEYDVWNLIIFHAISFIE